MKKCIDNFPKLTRTGRTRCNERIYIRLAIMMAAW